MKPNRTTQAEKLLTLIGDGRAPITSPTITANRLLRALHSHNAVNYVQPPQVRQYVPSAYWGFYTHSTVYPKVLQYVLQSYYNGMVKSSEQLIRVVSRTLVWPPGLTPGLTTETAHDTLQYIKKDRQHFYLYSTSNAVVQYTTVVYSIACFRQVAKNPRDGCTTEWCAPVGLWKLYWRGK